MIRATILLFAFPAVILCSPCQPGWTYFSETNSCYKALPTENPWTVSEFRCLFQGAHHTSITSQRENEFVRSLANYREVFIGAAFFGKTKRYVNSDQQPFGVYENWDTGLRPSLNRARRCIKMEASSGRWFQSCCKKYGAAVCKKPAPAPVPQPIVPYWMTTTTTPTTSTSTSTSTSTEGTTTTTPFETSTTTSTTMSTTTTTSTMAPQTTSTTFHPIFDAFKTAKGTWEFRRRFRFHRQ